MGKNTQKSLFIPLLGCFFFFKQMGANLHKYCARIITRLCVYGESRSTLIIDWGAIFFSNQNPVETLFII